MTTTNRGPGFKQHPGHQVLLERPAKRIQVTLSGETIADSNEVIELAETGRPPVFYLPREHVKMEWLVRTAKTTHCPYKGDASYFNLSMPNGRVVENAVWSYEQPYDEVLGIKERLAFYANKVDSIRTV